MTPLIKPDWLILRQVTGAIQRGCIAPYVRRIQLFIS